MKTIAKMAISLLALSILGCEENRADLAKKEKLASLKLALYEVGVNPDSPFDLFLRAFKVEKSLEVWVKNRLDNSFVLLKNYPVCAASGDLGPKRREGDYQVPEGFYFINRFNSKSKFYLSLGLNYPSESYLKIVDQAHPGGDIFIHGGCASVGCLAMTDDQIKEIYVLAQLAKEAGQTQIPVHIFPTKMTDSNISALLATMPANRDFWESLLPVYQFFELKKQLLR